MSASPKFFCCEIFQIDSTTLLQRTVRKVKNPDVDLVIRNHDVTKMSKYEAYYVTYYSCCFDVWQAKWSQEKAYLPSV
jgi:hypothetical protein